MKERPILFAGPMVQALLAGRKTQTRRLMKPQPDESWAAEYDPEGHITARRSYGWSWLPSLTSERWLTTDAGMLARCPYGVPGDRLWVRETHLLDPPIDDTWPSVGDTFARVDDIPAHYRTPEHVIYRATCDWSAEEKKRWRWRPSIFMPRWASRITLEATEVRVQRLQDISEEDAIAEGCGGYVYGHGPVSRSELLAEPGYLHDRFYRVGFSILWDEINAKRATWLSNPWVWAITFRPIA